MYKLAQGRFGSFETITLESPDGQNRLSIVPAFGATIIDLQLAGQSILDNPQTPDEMMAYQAYKNSILLPFPNRLKEGRYIWNNDEYTFFENDSITGNALHGFAMDSVFEVIKTELLESHSSITCRYENNGDIDAYPFPFTFEITYQLKTSGSFSVTMTFYNDGFTAIPVGLGWHPYFQLGEDISGLKLKMPPCEMVGVDKHMIPTGKRYEYDEFESERKIGATILDNCFALTNISNNAIAEVHLKSETTHLRYWQQTGEQQFNFLQIYTPPERDSIAIEPMTCNIDAFNNGEGLVVLLPHEGLEVRCGVEVFD